MVKLLRVAKLYTIHQILPIEYTGLCLLYVLTCVCIQHMNICNILHCLLQVVLHDQLGEIIPHYFTTDTSLSLRSLRPSTSYTFSVRTHNGEGVGPYCNEPSTFTTNSTTSGKYTCAYLYDVANYYMVSCHCTRIIFMYVFIMLYM